MARPKKSTRIQEKYFVWIVRPRDGVYYADGRKGMIKPGKHSLGTRDLNEAMNNLRQLDRKMAIKFGFATADSAPDTTVTNHISILQGWEKYFEHLKRPRISRGVGESTQRRYRAVRNKHILYCERHGVTGWAQIDLAQLERYLQFLVQRKLSERTCYLELTLLQSVIKFLIEHKLLPEHLKVRFSLIRPQGSDRFCYLLDHVQAMIEHCHADPMQPHWLAPIIQMLALTGLRIEELVGLRRTDLILNLSGVPIMIHLKDERSNSKQKALGGKLRQTKGGRDRMVPIDPALGLILKDMPQLPGGQLFSFPHGKELTQRRVRDAFIKDVILPLKGRFPTPKGEIGFEHGRLHSFRHFFVSRAFMCGANEGDIREWVGHRDSKIVELYRHLSPAEALRKLESLDIMNVRARADGLPSQSSMCL